MSFDFECRYYDTVKKNIIPVTFQDIMADEKQATYYLKRSLVISGTTRDGKTYIARSIARLMAVAQQFDTPRPERKFIQVTSAEDFKIDGITLHVAKDVPILFDDISPGRCMRHAAGPVESMKAMFTTKEASSLHLRNYNAILQKCCKIFTTNALTIFDLLALRDSQGDICPTHIEAMSVWCVFIKVKSRLYTPVQCADQDDVEDVDKERRRAKLKSAFEDGAI